MPESLRRPVDSGRLGAGCICGSLAPKNFGKPGSTCSCGLRKLPVARRYVGGEWLPASEIAIAVGSGAGLR